MRSSEYKQKIYEVFKTHHLLSLSEIHTFIPEAHFASIFRNVESLCEDGVLKKVVVDKNNIQYELASHDHGHFICNDCSSIHEVELKPFKKKTHHVSDVTIRGVCEDCS